MANIRKIEGKTGTAYKITVSQGRDSSGKQIRHYTTWTPPPGMTAKQAEKAALKAALEFESAIMRGLRPDDRQSFEKMPPISWRPNAPRGCAHRHLATITRCCSESFP